MRAEMRALLGDVDRLDVVPSPSLPPASSQSRRSRSTRNLRFLSHRSFVEALNPTLFDVHVAALVRVLGGSELVKEWPAIVPCSSSRTRLDR